MAEGPLNITTLCDYPLKRLFFITIKDNTQKTRWTKIGKINDWIKRYSDDYIIVKGTEGGIHFHLLAGLKPHKELKFQKGIHFYVKNLSDNNIGFNRDDLQWIRESDDLRCHIVDNNITHFQFALDIQQQNTLSLICSAIKKHFLKIKNRHKAKQNKTKKQLKIDSVIKYLYKNLNETRPDTIQEYTDYIVNYKRRC